MPRVIFTNQLARFLDAPAASAPGATLAEVFGNVFAAHPQLRSYILDDQGAVRQHVAVFIDGVQVTDRKKLSDSVMPESEIYVFQALSGG
ncbi:MAG: hypothetical protein WD075_04160 [Rhodospirillales bacterium]